MKRCFLLIIYYLLLYSFPDTDRIFPSVAKLRGLIVKLLFDDVGSHVKVRGKVNFGTGKGIRIGDYSLIGSKAVNRGPLIIGRHVLIAPELLVLPRNHNYDSRDIPISEQGSVCSPVTIGDFVWIGQRVSILSGVNIGEDAIIATGPL